MSVAEFGRWIDYFNRYGRCGPARMYDAGAALICWRIDQIMGIKTETKDYLPKFQESEQVATVDDVIREFTGMRVK